MMRRFGKLPIGAILLLVTLLALVVGWFYLDGKVEEDSSNSFTIDFKYGVSDSDYVDVRMDVAKSWINNEGYVYETVGAQYDGTIHNGYTSDIENWKLVIKMPAEGILDSSWNGSYSIQNNCIILTPDEYTNVIPAGEDKTFGFIMISDELLSFGEFQLIGYRQTTYAQYKLFWVIVGIAGVWIICFLTYLIVSIRMRTYERRSEKDSKIITQAMKTFAGLIDAKDPYTKGHSARVAVYSQELGRRLGMKKDEVRNMGYIGLMHDCGKIGVPDDILTKNKGLEPEERKAIEEHTTRGGYVLENFTVIKGIKEGAMYHHERYDGKGYPQGLKGADIPLCARIICVADAYDAMNSDRTYRSRLPREKIVKELDDNAGKQFDPDVVAHMLAMIREGFCDNPGKIKL